MATYTYSLSADFGNQICVKTLTEEILAEGSIVTSLSHITVSPTAGEDHVDIVFVSVLSGGEQTALDAVVAAHDGSVCPETDENYRTYSEAASANALAQAMAYTDSVTGAGGGEVDVYNDGTIITGSPFENQNFIDFTVTEGWYNASWLYRKKITIDYTKVAGTLVNFPVLIYISSDSDLSARARSDGYDILFTSADGKTKLNHERVTYATGTLQAWVKVPKLSSTKNTILYMYYGNSGASDQQNITGTWNPSHKAVYHFENSLLDSTSNNNDGSNNGSSNITGKTGLGSARDFDGNDYILYPYNGSLNITSQVTVEVWVNLVDPTDNQKVIANVNDSINRGFMLAVQSDSLYPEVWDSSGTNYTFTSGTVPTGQWAYLVITCAANGNLIGYINGTQVNSIPFSENNIGSNTDDMAIGACSWTPRAFYVDGQIDEVRISNTIRSQNWITTCYNNQNSPTTFFSLGSEQSDQSFVSIKVPDQVFGSRFTTANSLSESGQTSTTWQSKVLLTAPDLPAGKYRIGWYAEVRETDGAAAVEARILVNYSSVLAYAVIEPQDTNNYYPFGGCCFLDVTGETNFVRVNFQWREMGSGTAYIRNARLEIWRVS